MPRTIHAALAEFRALQVDLDPSQVTQARSSRDFLKTSLVAVTNRTPGFPRLTGEVQQFGSFARRTKIRPLDDIDLMFVITLGAISIGSNWSSPGSVIVRPASVGVFSFGPQPPPVERRFLNVGGQVSSTVVLNELRARLRSVPQYANAEIKRNGSAIVLGLNSYPWRFDVVPALTARDGRLGGTLYYVIPDGEGGWQKTDPRRDAQRITLANRNSNGRLLPLIRLMKFWNAHNRQPLHSYHLETLCIRAFPWGMGIASDLFSALQKCFSHVAGAVMQACPDPKGLGPDLSGYLDPEARQRVARLSAAASSMVQQALAAVSRGDQAAASRCLQQVFGALFPVCP